MRVSSVLTESPWPSKNVRRILNFGDLLNFPLGCAKHDFLIGLTPTLNTSHIVNGHGFLFGNILGTTLN